MSVLVVHSFLILGVATPAQAFSGGGTGTTGDPYRITSCGQLAELNNSSDNFLLRGDLNCSSVSYSPIENFHGILDGRNHAITNINYSSGNDNVGLFAVLDGGSVKNLFIRTSSFSGHYYVSTVAGSAYNGASIQNVQVSSGTISGQQVVGGLVGEADGGVQIEASSFGGSVTANTTSGGGIVGILEGSSIHNSYSTGIVSGAGSIGGMAGRLTGLNGISSIANSYSTTTVTNSAGRAGLAGMNLMGNNVSITNSFVAANTDGAPALFASTQQGTPTITNNYFDAGILGSDTNCQAGSIGDGCTAVNLGGSDQAYFFNNSTAAPLDSWDFTTVWQTVTDSYPVLRAASLSTLDPAVAPGVVANVHTTPGDSRANLWWNMPAEDGGGEITDYQFSYRVTGQSDWTDSHTSSNLPFTTIFGFSNGEHYDFRVAATNSAGTGDYTELDNQIIGTAPSAVQNLQAVNNSGQALITWDSPSDTGSTPIDGYYVSYVLHGESTWSDEIGVSADSSSAGIDGLATGDYDFKVRAHNTNGYGDYSSVSIIHIETPSPQVYNISTCQQLQDIANDMSGNYTLTQDIDCSETSTWNDNMGFSPIGIEIGAAFTGTLDGQGYAITGLVEDYTGATHGPYGLGLFYTTEGATIQNLSINDSSFNGSGGGGVFAAYANNTTATNLRSNATIISVVSDEVGGLFGSFTGDDDRTLVVLSNSEFTGSVRSDSYTGGLVGYSGNVTIHDSYVHGTVVSLNGANDIGGIVGYSDNTAIDNVYSSAKIETDGNGGASYLGGLVGTMHTDSEISNSFAAGSIDTTVDVYGAVVAAGDAAQNLTNVYYDGSETGDHYCAGIGFAGGPGDGPTCIEVNADGTDPNYFLTNHSNAPLDQWDFTNIWHIQVNDYPVFSDEYIPQAYEVSTCEDLQNMGQDLQGDYELINDIDCSQSATWDGGAGFLPIASGRMEGFSGSLNGNGYTISNLTIDRPDAYVVGMIEGLNGGYIYDFALNNAHITGSSVVGAVVAAAYSAGIFDVRVSDSSVTATNNFEGDVTQTSAGGIVGSFSSDLQGMYGMAQDSFTGTVTGVENVGGLAGSYGGAVIFDSYANAAVSGRNNIGGLVGQMNLGYFDNVYAAGTVSADGSDGGGVAGGLVGTASSLQVSDSFAVSTVAVPQEVIELGNGFIGALGDDSVEFSNDYYNSDNGTGTCAATLGGPVVDENCTGISLSGQPSFFKGNTNSAPLDGWDFEGTWYMHENAYPTLYPLQEPEIECEELSGTSTTVNVRCDAFPDGWGTTTWEMQYQVSGSETWTDVTLPDAHQAMKTITGLTPNTDYIVRFRFTNDWGTSDWGHIDYLTDSIAPVPPAPVASSSVATPEVTAQISPTTAVEQIAVVSAEATKLLLDDYSGYTAGSGKKLELVVGQVIYFYVGGELHSATVKEIGADFVVLTIASTPFDVRLSLGETKNVSVHQDGTPSLSISLKSVDNGRATIAFARPHDELAASSRPVNSPSNLGWVLILFVMIAGLGFYVSDASKPRRKAA